MTLVDLNKKVTPFIREVGKTLSSDGENKLAPPLPPLRDSSNDLPSQMNAIFALSAQSSTRRRAFYASIAFCAILQLWGCHEQPKEGLVPSSQFGDRQTCEEVARALSGEPSGASEVPFVNQRLFPGVAPSAYGFGAFNTWGTERFAWLKFGKTEFLAFTDGDNGNPLCPGQTVEIVGASAPIGEIAGIFEGDERIYTVGNRTLGVSDTGTLARVVAFDEQGHGRLLCTLKSSHFRNVSAPAYTRGDSPEGSQFCALAARGGLKEVPPSGTAQLHDDDAQKIEAQAKTVDLWHLKEKGSDYESHRLTLARVKPSSYGGHKGWCRAESDEATWLLRLDDKGRLAYESAEQANDPHISTYRDTYVLALPHNSIEEKQIVLEMTGGLMWPRLLTHNDKFFVEAAPDGAERTTSLYQLRIDSEAHAFETCRFKRFPTFQIVEMHAGK